MMRDILCYLIEARALSNDIDDVIIRKADSFIPERDNFNHNDDLVVYDKNERGYAV